MMIVLLTIFSILVGGLNASKFVFGSNIIINDEAILIFPGTKWCGAGNIAENYEDLGSERETDKCCRDHDNCDYIRAGETKYNLTNPALHSRVACKCEGPFRTCLKKVNTGTSNTLGFIYFVVLKTYCFKEDFVCTEYRCYFDQLTLTFKKECLKQELKYAWYPVRGY